MIFQIEAPITCTVCNRDFTGAYYVIIDTQHTPKACEQLLAGELNIVTCPFCHSVAAVDDSLLYHDGP